MGCFGLAPAESAQMVSHISSAHGRKAQQRALSSRIAPLDDYWRELNSYFHEEDERYMRFLVPREQQVLELGCGTGHLLAALDPAVGVGIDISHEMAEVGQHRYPQYEFFVGDIEDVSTLNPLEGRKFDFVVLSDIVGVLEDIHGTFDLIHRFCTPDTRVIVAYYSWLWEPLLRLVERLGLKQPTLAQNFLGSDDIERIVQLAGFEVVRIEWRQLLPKRLYGLGEFVNRYMATLPLLRKLCVRNYVVLRSTRNKPSPKPSCTVLIPCRNERGNIEVAIQRMPRFAERMEILFVEGHSQDGTLEEIHRVKEKYPEWDIKAVVQDGRGKGDAVRKGFGLAKGEVLMILDADLTVPPEQLPKFYTLIASGDAEFVNGSRLVYPLERQAMRLLNLLANHLFARTFTYLLNQRLTDTLCGTKVLRRSHYEKIAAGRGYFGDFDPFGDFDLILGAAKLNLKFAEVPIRYAPRTYGETQISRFRHGLLLARMVIFAYRTLKAF